MANQTEQKPTLVLMAGLPGAGKTTLAAELGHALRWPVLVKDTLKNSLLNTVLTKKLTKDDASFHAYDGFFALAHDMLVKQQLSIILDSTARPPCALERATELARLADAQLKVILCVANSNVRADRVARRDGILHKIKITTVEEDLEHFNHLPADTFMIYTTCPLAVCVAGAVRYLTTE